MHTITLRSPLTYAGAGLLLINSVPAFADSGSPLPWLWPWLNELPDWTPSAALAILFAGLTWLTLTLLSRWRPATATRPKLRHSAVAGGLVVGAVLGLMLANPWKAFLFNRLPATAGVGMELLEAPIPKDVPFNPKKPNKVKGNRARHAKVNLDALRQPKLTLNLFDDTLLTAVRDREAENARGGTVWIGHIEGYDDNSQVVLAARGKALVGTVIVDGRAFEIAYAGGSTHAVRELKPNGLPPQVEPAEEARLNPDELETAADVPEPGGLTATGDGTPPAAGNNVGLMMLYTPRVLANAGGLDGVNAKIDNAVAQANLAYANSGIDIHLYVVHTAQVAYTETGDIGNALSDLQARSDGSMDEIHALRDQYAADLVTLVTGDSSNCGMAFLMTTLSTGAAPAGFAVVHDDSVWDCIGTHQSLAHELGHTMGNVHNIENSGGQGLFDFSYGYRLCGVFSDIMAYSCQQPEPRIPYFSNPNVTHDGLPTGLATADTARSMNLSAPYVAGFRNPLTAAPGAPSNLTATSPITGSVYLTWTDNANTETGYRVESSLDGTNWTEVASLLSDRVNYSESNLPTGKTYYYRVYAWNPVGNSGYSNTASIVLQAPGDTTPPVPKISNPLPGTRITATATSVSVKASATDNVKVKSLKVYIDNRLVASTTASSLSYTWSVKTLAAGAHTIRADAMDTSANTASTSVTVTK